MASTAKPTRKITATGLGGALSIIAVWVAGLFGLDMPVEVAAAVTVVLSTGAGYLTRDPLAPTAPRSTGGIKRQVE